jgi:L-asparagine transporter-like permease
MFQKQIVKAFSIVAIVLSAIGIILSVVATLVIQGGSATFGFFLGIVTWALLLWSSIIAYQLCSYQLEEEQYKKVGLRIYAIIIAFILFFFVGLLLGIIISVAIFATLWALKSNYDDWEFEKKNDIV